ncbi:UDP-N-acetylglucosamine--undecaprenyl-phosphate N-acetylglucosaminephosphotransferase [Photobacterium sp. MCCC 1A19761]|uniref:UDP-N-acetylglucosamine--undecaprenyl-phosphate N-acetylglucosaminephosphotransferase n=1 Tax=Photobacterium sp. MCCC 1A19761 TaxID=3115000 RepID=UPI00307E569C
MDMELPILFSFSLVSLFALRVMAKKIQLVDIPNGRKQHQGVIPLVGGIAIFGSVFVGILLSPDIHTAPALYLSCATVLVLMGAIDDKFDISVKSRLFVQILMSAVMIAFGNLKLTNLGNISGFQELTLSTPLSYLVTIFAILGAINAFNMVDGIDGLLGGLATVSFTALGYLFWTGNQVDLYQFCVIFVVATIPYIMMNLGLPFGRRFKIFMGDAGSVFIGFTIVWLLVQGTQGEETSFRPVTALWIIALPLMDMATIMIRRIQKGQSPFKPDREHLHHICQRVGLSQRMTLVTICSIAGLFAYVGILSEQYQIHEAVMFLSFLLVFTLYYFMISHIWRITTWIRKLSFRRTPFKKLSIKTQTHLKSHNLKQKLNTFTNQK